MYNIDQSFYEREKNKREKLPIIVLFIIAFVFKIVAFLASNVQYSYFTKKYALNLRFSFSLLVDLFIAFVPYILVITYVIISYNNNKKGYIIVPMIFGFVAMRPMLITTVTIVRSIRTYGYINVYYGYFYIMFMVATLVLFMFTMFSTLRGFNKKLLLIFACSTAMLHSLCACMSNVGILWYYAIRYSYYTHYITVEIIATISTILFYVMLLIFGLKVRDIPHIWPEKTKRVIQKALTPEQKLASLKERLELGVISEEEYKRKLEEMVGGYN